MILPIPGTSKVSHLEDNVTAATISLADDEVAQLSALS
ncbi:Aldo/keto reductase family protein [Streptomyces sp. MnatMP-M27]|nr:Aldo/keto reductase family protein [Streptomyces sp. MnatMP-M27]